MNVIAKAVNLCVLIGLVFLSGCRSREMAVDMDRYFADVAAGEISPIDFVRTPSKGGLGDLSPQQTGDWLSTDSDGMLPPRLREPWELTLEEAVQLTLSQSEVIRNIGGAVVNAPDSATTVFDPAIVETDPIYGIQAALSAFDAQLGTRLFFSGTEDTLNNVIEGQGTRDPRANNGLLDVLISKTAATGTQLSFGNLSAFDRNNSPLNWFPESYTADFRGEIRQPLAQGSGLQFNQIAGPVATPGKYRGVQVARLNTDVEIADFQAAIRDLLYNVERAYWDLSFAYRDLDAKLMGRDAALATWRAVQARLETGDADGAEEALARERFYAASSAVEDAFCGKPVGVASRSTPTNGVYGYESGLLAAERRLRFLMGLPVYDGKLIQPVDEPIRAAVVFDRLVSLGLALQHRIELRRQKLTIQRQEMELIAARSFLQPRLDMIGRYRMHGFGQDLFGSAGMPNSGAYSDLFRADLQDWVVGLEWNSPVGFRQGHAAVRSAQLKLMRQVAILREQEHQIAHELDAAFVDLDRAFATSRTNYNRRVAARQRFDAVRDKYLAGDFPLEFIELDLQRAIDAESAFARSQFDHEMALATVHFARGTYLDYLGVHLSEAPNALMHCVSAGNVQIVDDGNLAQRHGNITELPDVIDEDSERSSMQDLLDNLLDPLENQTGTNIDDNLPATGANKLIGESSLDFN